LPPSLPPAGPPPLEAAPDTPPPLPGLSGAEPVEELPEAQPAPLDLLESRAKATLHVLCPSGHTLEVTRDMLGNEAMCPQCQKKFLLRVSRSLEYQWKKAQTIARKEKKLGQIWLSVAIVAAVLVVAALVTLLMSGTGH
jgi:hypothetical protein